MGSVKVVETVDAGADRVWELFRDFGGVTRFSAGIQSCTVEGEGVGAVRTITLPGDTKLHEQLTAHDDAGRSFSYAIVRESPLPVRDYLATFKLSELGPDRCRIEWGSSFELGGLSEDDTRPMIEGIYTSGIASLKATLGV